MIEDFPFLLLIGEIDDVLVENAFDFSTDNGMTPLEEDRIISFADLNKSETETDKFGNELMDIIRRLKKQKKGTFK